MANGSEAVKIGGTRADVEGSTFFSPGSSGMPKAPSEDPLKPGADENDQDALDEEGGTATGEEEGKTDGGEQDAEQTAKALALPMGWSPEKKALWEGLPREAQELIASWKKEQDGLLTKKSQELGDLAKYAGKQDLVEALKYHEANPESLKIMRFVEGDPLLGPAVAKLISSYGQALQAGKKDEWRPEATFSAPEPRADLKKYLAMKPEDLRDALMDDPEMLTGLLKEVSRSEEREKAMEERVRQMLAPFEAQRKQADEQAALKAKLDKTISTLRDSTPEADRPLLFGADGAMSPDAASAVDKILEERGPEWVKAGKTPEQALELAIQAHLATRKEAAALEAGKKAGLEETRRKRQAAAAAAGGGTGGSSSLSQSLSNRMKEQSFPEVSIRK